MRLITCPFSRPRKLQDGARIQEPGFKAQTLAHSALTLKYLKQLWSPACGFTRALLAPQIWQLLSLQVPVVWEEGSIHPNDRLLIPTLPSHTPGILFHSGQSNPSPASRICEGLDQGFGAISAEGQNQSGKLFLELHVSRLRYLWAVSRWVPWVPVRCTVSSHTGSKEQGLGGCSW